LPDRVPVVFRIFLFQEKKHEEIKKDGIERERALKMIG